MNILEDQKLEILHFFATRFSPLKRQEIKLQDMAFEKKTFSYAYLKKERERAGVNILAWNHKLFPKGIFQDKKLFPMIYSPNLIIALHLQEIAFITPFNIWKVASLSAKAKFFARSQTELLHCQFLTISHSPFLKF